MPELVELLFFDTFAHDNTEEINLDLVQFPKPVYITEVRIIPLGARVQADFPGGVRLGATNPSQFKIEFFVNDLGKPGASTFESLGDFEYNQNGCINLDCSHEQDSIRRIPTDGLVLRGWYTTITLAVYGTLTNNITEQIVQPVVANPATLPTQPSTIPDPQKIITVGVAVEPEAWSQENVAPVVVVAPPEYVQNNAPYQAPPPYVPPETVYSSTQEYTTEYYSDVPKDPRSYHHTPETEWDTKRSRVSDIDRDKERDRDRERSRDAGYQKSSTNEKDHGRSGESDRRDRDRTYTSSSSHGRDRDRTSREYREVSREQDWDHDRADYGRTTTADWDRERSHGRDRDRSDRDRDRDRGVDRDRDRGDRDRDRDRFYKHGDENYRRSSYNRDDRDGDRKRPRTPPIQSPKRPHTPINERKETTSSPPEIDSFSEEELVDAKKATKEEEPPKSPASKEAKEPTPPVEEPVQQMDVEEFEPILSDEDILDEDVDYDYNTYTNNDDLIKLFVPGATPLRKFEIETFKITNEGITIDENLKIQIGIVDDHFKSSITKYTLKDFTKLTVEIKEEFIHICEKLINIFSSADNFVKIVKLYTLAKSVSATQFSADDKELLEQINCSVELVVDWLIIALNYEMANIQDQPAYKIRHIKCGVRLAEWCCNSEEFVRLLWDYKFNVHEVLLDLYDQEYMAMSIKLMIVKALDTYLSHKFAIEKFLIRNENCKENGFHGSYHATPRINGYKAIVEKILKNSSVRLKFALHSVLIKLNLYEVFNKMSAILTTLRNSELSKDDMVLLVKLLEQIQNAFQGGQFVYSQPKRFLPVSAQFEIGQQVKNVSVNFFKMFDVIQSFFLLLSCKATMNLEAIKNPVLEILCQLSRSKDGLDYLSQNCETLNSLLKCLLQSDEELYSLEDCVKSQNVGIEIAYKVETLYYVESLDKIGHDYDDPEVVNQLHGLFCLTFTHAGRLACAEVLSMEDNIKCLLQFFSDIYVKDKSESVANKIKKSPGMAYIIDVIAATVVHTSNVPFLETYHKHLNQLIEYQYLFEDTTKFNEIQAYLTPLDNIVLHYDNISHFVDIVSKEVENATAFSGELITSLRILQYLGISQHPLNTVYDNMLRNYVELKYKHVILQLFSLDGVTILTKLLQKICDHYKQPTLYTSIFVSNRGLQIINVMKPCVELLKHMLSYVIQCQNTNFKDLTAIPVLLQSYTLLSSFPSTTYAHLEAQSICSSIIDTLLVYTQPISDEIHEKDSLNKTLWSLMCGEAIKYVTQSPCTYLSGLLILSEILPLPLPIEANDDLSQDEILWAVNLRRLWSAHLHPHCGNIQDLIGKLCTTSHHQLLNLLRRVCVQLADLAANSALMITRGILDVIHKALVIDDSKVEPCSSHSARLLNFLACLVTHSTIKCSILHLLHNSSTKGDEKYPALVQVFMNILKQSNSSTSHIQAQECILSIIQSFCDVEITLLQNPPKITSDLYLSNALPMKEQLLIFISTMVEHLQMDNSLVTYLQVLRTLILLTEHDYGFYHLTEQLNRKGNIFGVLLNKLVGTFSKENAECLSTINTVVEFLQICSATEEVEAPLLYTPRKMKMSISEVAELIGWKKPVESDGEDTTHPLLLLQDHLKKICDEDITFEALHDGITTLKNLLQLEQPDSKETPFVEPILPEPEPLLGQFSARSVFIRSTDALNERLTIRYWLSAASDEVENENITCDLTEITRQFLPQEFNLIREIEKLCRICPLENVSEKERHDDHKTKMKKTFVTPMRSRGFPRTVQQRSDLFRSRPPNTSRPPSLHVDDFVALETCGAQPTGPTGYNKFSRDLLASSRIGRGSRGRTFVMSERSVHCRQMTWWGTSLVRRPYQ